MRRARNPCRQLNSEGIKGAALCYLSPIISNKCSIISAKCVCNVRCHGLETAWLNVCRTRDTCDKALLGMKNIAFFFSSISTHGMKLRGKKGTTNHGEDDESEESNDEAVSSSQAAAQASQEWISNHRTIVDKKLSPAVVYWIALTTPNGAPANGLSVHRALLECGVETVANQVKFQESKESVAMKELYKLFKDHNNSFMQELVSSSFKATLMEAATEILDESAPLLEVEQYGMESVVRINLVNKSFQPVLLDALSKLENKKLHIDRLGFDVTTASASDETSKKQEEEVERLSDNLTVLVNDIGIAMKEIGYAVYRGKIYKKVEKAKYTYSYRCEPRAFIHSLAANDGFKARLLKDMKKVIEILSDPYCEVIRPIILDYNLIEVEGNHCWSIKERRFLNSPISDDDIGLVTPRACCSYNHLNTPQPTYFRDILENSLSAREVETFCEDFLRLLKYNKKKHKDKVPCLVGDTNSGKTSLFLPILGIIHHTNIATVTKQKVFNKAMINKNTEVIFIDEATPNTLDIDDWKILTQGGYAAHDVKYQTAKSFINRCPMIITSQKELEFDPVDQAAMDRRLRTYKFKALPNPKKKASEWLRKHAMDCIVWAASKARSPESEEESESGTDSDGIDEDTLKECEKEELRTLVLADLLTKRDKDNGQEETDDIVLEPQARDEDEEENQNLVALRRAQRQCAPGSLRFRQINHLLQGQVEILNEEKEREERNYRRRQEILVSKGVSRELIELLPRNELEPMPQPILLEMDNIHQELLKKREEEEKEKIKTTFENPWIERTERHLKACVVKLQAIPLNSNHRKSVMSLQNLLSDKLKTHHKNIGLFKCKAALLERHKKCIEWGLLEDKLKHQVTSLYEVLPLSQEPVEETEDEEDLVTPEQTVDESTPSQSLFQAAASQASSEKQGFMKDQVKRRTDSQEAGSSESSKSPKFTSLFSYFRSSK